MTEAKRKPKTKAKGRRISPVAVKKFAQAYVENDGNGTQAVLTIKDMSAKVASVTSSRLLKREDVQLEIQKALEANGIGYDYVLKTRKKYVDTGVHQLEHGVNRDEDDVIVTPSDVSKHLQGIENVLEKVGVRGNSTSSNNHLHLHLEGKTHQEILSKRHETAEWFNDILSSD